MSTRANYTQDIVIKDGPYVDVRAYGEGTTLAAIQAAIAAIGSDNKTLFFAPGTWTITDNLTVPINISVKIMKGAVLAMTAGKTLNINGGVEAGIYQLFSGTGLVRFGGYLSEMYPQWWGAKADGSTDDTTAIQAALDAAMGGSAHEGGGGKTVVFPSGHYITSATLTIGEAANATATHTIMPSGAYITSSAATYAVSLTNGIRCKLELRLYTDNNGVLVEQSGVKNCIFNYISGFISGTTVRAATKPAVGVGTAGITFASPAGGFANYYNQVENVYFQNFDIDVHLEASANGQRLINNEYYGYWTGIQMSSSDNTVLGGFWTNAEGSGVAGDSEGIRIGNGVSASGSNSIFCGAEPANNFGTMVVIDPLSHSNIVIVNNDTAVHPVIGSYVLNTIIQKRSIITESLQARGSTRVWGTSYFSAVDQVDGTMKLITKEASHTLAAAAISITTNIDIPDKALLFGASFTVKTAITGATAYKISYDGGSTTEIVGSQSGVAINSKIDGFIVPEVANAETNIKFEKTGGGDFSAGVINIVVYYWEFRSLDN